MEFKYALVLPRDASTVSIVRALCGTTLTKLGVKEGCIADIEVALTEACTNVLKHAGIDREYEVTIGISESRCDIRVVDGGAGFDHHALGLQDAGPDSEGGRGIQLMRALVDELRFVSESQVGTVVHLAKKLELEPGSALRRLSDQARLSAAGQPAPIAAAWPKIGSA